MSKRLAAILCTELLMGCTAQEVQMKVKGKRPVRFRQENRSMNKYEKLDLVLKSLCFCVSAMVIFPLILNSDQVTSYTISVIGASIVICIIYFIDKKYQVSAYFHDYEHSLTFWGRWWGLLGLYVLIFIVACVVLNWHKYN